jgi:hypothetical protein
LPPEDGGGSIAPGGVFTKMYTGWSNYKNVKSGNYNRYVCGGKCVTKDGPGMYHTNVVVIPPQVTPVYHPHTCNGRPDPAISKCEKKSCHGWLSTCQQGPVKHSDKLSGNGYTM